MNVKALSIKQPDADYLIDGRQKTMEVRSWRTHHRGPLLICSSARPLVTGRRSGHAIGIVNVIDCRPMRPEDEGPAMTPYEPGLWVWLTDDRRRIEPFPVRGQMGLYDVPLPVEIRLPGPPQPETFSRAAHS